MLDRNRQLQLQDPYGRTPDLYYDGAQNFDPYGRYQDQQEEGFNPLSLFLYVVRYRWLIVTLAAAGLVLAFVITMMLTPKYQATSRLEVLVPSARVFQDIEVVSETGDMRAFLTAREKIKSRALAQRVVFDLGLAENPEFLSPVPDFAVSNVFYRAFGLDMRPANSDWTAEERESIAIGRLLGGLSVDLVPNTSLISITFRDQNPELASEIANQVARSFIDQRVDQTSETSELARQFIQEQVLQVKEKLQASEQALVDYAKNAGITVTGEERSLIGANIEALNTALAAAIQERLDYGRLVTQIEAGQGESLGQVLNSEGLQSLRSKIAELSGEYQQKLGLFKPGFPEMVQLQAQIKELRRQLDGGIRAIIDSIKLKHQETIEKENNLRQELAGLEQQQVAFNDKNIQYTILKREVDSNRSQYDTLITKLNEAGVSSELKTQSAQIVDLAVTPGRPFSPKLSLNLAVGLALFLALAAAIIYILELLNNTFTNTEQVEKELGLPVFGILPKVDEREFIASIGDPKSGLSEAYRTLRTSLQFSGAEGAPKTLLVTSAEPSEGKTTTSFKLGQDFAALGAKVLLIDGDLRKPNLHRMFGFDNVLGLSNLLTNTVHRDQLPNLLKKTKVDNLFVLTSGTIPPNPADLLSSPRMALITGSLSKRFDLIIIDAPPIVGLADAPILSRIAQGTLVVVSTNQVTRKAAKAAIKRLKAAGSNVVGVAMTKFSVNKFDYNYAYRYMNYQYYSYGEDKPQLEAPPAARESLQETRQGSGGGSLAERIRARFQDIVSRAKAAA
jgi:capsular exopolysaccharide synthesis family protein